jgi:hypothetical protein
MRDIDLKQLEQPYPHGAKVGHRFAKAINAEVPSSGILAEEIANDLDIQTLGIAWWNHLPFEARVLIGDYLYQCTSDIETNLLEAKLHLMELVHLRELQSKEIEDSITLVNGIPVFHRGKNSCPSEDLPSKLASMHLAGFFRAIGSSLDCIGAAIVGVLGLSKNLRRANIGTAENALRDLIAKGTATPLEMGFHKFYDSEKHSAGPVDWLEWTTQYRNALVHRGRLVTQNEIAPAGRLLNVQEGQLKIKAKLVTHATKFPDRSEAESWIRSKYMSLGEDIDSTLHGVFASCQQFEEAICEQLVTIWQTRRQNPGLILQPVAQWNTTAKGNVFPGYKAAPSPDFDEVTSSPTFRKRMAAAGLDTKQRRKMWDNSRWK